MKTPERKLMETIFAIPPRMMAIGYRTWYCTECARTFADPKHVRHPKCPRMHKDNGNRQGAEQGE